MNAIDYLQRGLDQATAMLYQDAILSFNEALNLNGALIDAYYNRGLAYLKTGCYLFAIADFSEVLQTPVVKGNVFLPQDLRVLAHCHRGRAHHFLGHNHQALADFDQALKLDFYNAEAYQRRGLVKLDLGRKQEALEDLQTAAHLNYEAGKQLEYEQTEKLIRSLF